jgi:hypothetical protein
MSLWTVTELHSALALKVRTGALSPTQADGVLEGVAQSLSPGLRVLNLDPQDLLNANACLRSWTTRACRPAEQQTGARQRSGAHRLARQ